MIDTKGSVIPPEVAVRERIRALESYDVLDTAAEDAFDDVVTIAAEVCGAPTALISLVAEARQWFKARIGFDQCETPIDHSVCAHALDGSELLVIPDLTRDPRTAGNPLVTGPEAIRFYGGAAIRTASGHTLGSVCVLDVKPRPEGLTATQNTVLRALARQVMAMLETRKALIRSVEERIDQAVTQHGRDAAARIVQEHEFKLRLAVEATSMGIFDYDLVTGGLVWDQRVRELFGLSPDSPVSYEGAFLAGVHPDDRAAADAAVQAALDPDGPGVFDHEYRTVAPDGRVRWLAARGRSIVDGGRTLRFVGTVRDVTVRRTADDQIATTLERYRLVGRVTKDVIWDWDLTTGHVLWNDAITAAYGYPPVDVAPTLQWWLERVHPEDRERIREAMASVAGGSSQDWSQGYRFRRADGSWADVFDRGSAVRDAGGRPLRMIGAMIDDSERKAEQTLQNLLSRELSHRMKNILTIVQAITGQTMRAAETMEEAQTMLVGRLAALGKAHDILLGEQVERADLSRLIDEAVRLHFDAADRIALDGPAIDIGSKATLPLVLMLHELATNAAKYGALSNADGRVLISWQVRPAMSGEETFRLEWIERGGPTVTPSGKRGFGSRLIERGLAAQLGGTATLAYPPEGAACVLEVPLERLVEAS